MTLIELRDIRKERSNRKRRIIFNNDGGDSIDGIREATPDELLKRRTSPLVGSHVDTMFYATSMSFCFFTHNTRAADIFTVMETDTIPYNITRKLIEQGTDALQIMVDFCTKNSIEIFWSMRMNDTHDANPSDIPTSQFKKDHPDYLFGTQNNRPKHGAWSGVDYGCVEVRERAFQSIKDVCERYEIDGIEMDFFRHPVLFKRHAWGNSLGKVERDIMTEFLRRVRNMTEEVGLKRGQPFLIAVRVPDSVGYSEAIGLEIKRWLEEDLIDILVVSGYFHLTPWETSVALGHKYNVPVYPSLDESRIKGDAGKARNQLESYRARALNVWSSGADGVYIYNIFDPHHPLWWELGDTQLLERLNKDYYAAVRGFQVINGYLDDGERFLRLPTLSPERPEALKPNKPLIIPVWVGDNVKLRKAGDIAPEIILTFIVDGIENMGDFYVKLNGQALSGGFIESGKIEYRIMPELVLKGKNIFEIAIKEDRAPAPVIYDLQLHINYNVQ